MFSMDWNSTFFIGFDTVINLLLCNLLLEICTDLDKSKGALQDFVPSVRRGKRASVRLNLPTQIFLSLPRSAFIRVIFQMMGCGVSKMERKEFLADRSMFFIDQLMGEGGFGKVMTTQFVKNKKWWVIIWISAFIDIISYFDKLLNAYVCLQCILTLIITTFWLAFYAWICRRFPLSLSPFLTLGMPSRR